MGRGPDHRAVSGARRAGGRPPHPRRRAPPADPAHSPRRRARHGARRAAGESPRPARVDQFGDGRLCRARRRRARRDRGATGPLRVVEQIPAGRVPDPRARAGRVRPHLHRRAAARRGGRRHPPGGHRPRPRRGRDPQRPGRGHQPAATSARTSAGERRCSTPAPNSGAAELGVLASLAVAHPLVFRRPRVGILGGGDEIVDVDQPEEILSGRKVASSNSHTLARAGAAGGRRAAQPRPRAGHAGQPARAPGARAGMRPAGHQRPASASGSTTTCGPWWRRWAGRSTSGSCACGPGRRSGSARCSACRGSACPAIR